jgi:stress response protein SCP2
MDLHTVPEDCPHVAFALATEGPSLRQLRGLTATVRTEQGEELARYVVEDIPDSPGLVVAEVYRRSDQWKVRAIGQGLAEGYTGLLRSFALAA